jgi:hypothetical protein
MKQIEMPAGLDWEKILQELKTDELVFTREGHAVALLSEFDDDELYWRAREEDPEFIASIARGREQIAEGKVTSHEDLKRKLGIE